MKADYSRFSFDRSKHFTQVLEQQGRVRLDADWNEHSAIREHLARTTRVDAVGDGAPDARSFRIHDATPSGSGIDFTVDAGRFYLGGWLIENEAACAYTTQPHCPGGAPLPTSSETDEGTGGEVVDLIYLDAWQRHITAVEDPTLLEPALGGVDTTTRIQTIWQVRARRTDARECCELPAIAQPEAPTGFCTASLQGGGLGEACELPSPAEYTGIENRLYRVEVYDPGDVYGGAGDARVGATPELASVSRNAAGFSVKLSALAADVHVGQMFEIYSDPVGGQLDPGVLIRVEAFDVSTSTFTVSQALDRYLSGTPQALVRRIATFTWSRLDGAPLLPINLRQAGDDDATLNVSTLGRDRELQIQDGDWIEVSNEETDLAGLRGLLARIRHVDRDRGKIYTEIPVSSHVDAKLRPKLRRWELVPQDAVAQPAAAPEYPLVVVASEQPIERGIAVTFSGRDLRAGDAWTFTARAATRSISDLLEAPPTRIEHRYAPLGLIRHGADGIQVTDCRPRFGSLVEVDDEFRRLRRMLHGSGVVCGLGVRCDEGEPGVREPRTHVIIEPGYALDAHGREIIVDAPIVFPIIDGSSEPGDYCLRLFWDPVAGYRVERERESGKSECSLSDIFEGTIWADFKRDCIDGPLEQIQKALATNDRYARRTYVTTANNWVEATWPSAETQPSFTLREHELLKSFYDAVVGALHDETFCALLESVRPFPVYPFSRAPHKVSFTYGYPTRVRLSRDEHYAFAVMPDRKIEIHSIEGERLLDELDFAASPSDDVELRDVASGSDPATLWVAATINQSDTRLRQLKLGSGDTPAIWGDPKNDIVLRGSRVTAVLPDPTDPDILYASAIGQGLQIIDLRQASARLLPFDAAGHLAITVVDGRPVVVATTSTKRVTDGSYDSFVVVQGDDVVQSVALRSEQGEAREGTDDIAVRTDAANTVWVYAVSTAAAGREVLVYDMRQVRETQQPTKAVFVGRGKVRLAVNEVTGHVLLSLAEQHRIAFVQTSDHCVAEYQYPTEYAPGAIVTGAKYLAIPHQAGLNLMFVPAAVLADSAMYLNGAFASDGEMDTYRTALLDALTDLLAAILQYLKDCFCYHLLVKCPSCGDEAKDIYLGCVTVKNAGDPSAPRVYRICNFSKRRYVKTFQTYGYWLSTIPILPLLKGLVASFCCSILPQIFAEHEPTPGKASAPDPAKPPSVTMRGRYLRIASESLFNTDLSQLKLDAFKKIRPADALAEKWLVTNVRKEPYEDVTLDRHEVPVFVPPERTMAQLDKVGVKYTVRDVDASNATGALFGLLTARPHVTRGQSVVLYRSNGQILGYEVEGTPALLEPFSASLPASAATVQHELAKRDVVLSGLQDAMAGAPSPERIQTLERRLAALDSALADADKARDELSKQHAAQLDELHRSLATLEDDRRELGKSIDTLNKSLEGITERLQQNG